MSYPKILTENEERFFSYREIANVSQVFIVTLVKEVKRS